MIAGFVYTLTKSATFEAAHRLPAHDGKCARLHGHSWRILVEVGADALHAEGPKAGMAADFGDVGRPLKALVEESLDHWHLNESTGLDNPTSEAIAEWAYHRLADAYERLDVTLVAVTVEETCTSRARYEP
ncbi:MAG: 6-carboxytetrahydropterin synthase QueD [Pseudomonadota bacterium]